MQWYTQHAMIDRHIYDQEEDCIMTCTFREIKDS